MIPIFAAFIALFIFSATSISSAEIDHKKQLPKIFNLLKNGNSKDKKEALRELWVLQYHEYRKGSKVWEPVLMALKDLDPSVREAAAASLKTIGKGMQGSEEYIYKCCNKTNIVPSLIVALKDNNPLVRAEAAKALGMFRMEREDGEKYVEEKRAIDPLIQALKDKDPRVRLNAAWSLGEIKDMKITKALLDYLAERPDDWRDKFVQQEVIIAIRKQRKRILAFHYLLIKVFMDIAKDEYLRLEVVKTLKGSYLGTPEVKEFFKRVAKDPDKQIRKHAIEGLSEIIQYSGSDAEVSDATKMFIKDLKSSSANVRSAAAKALKGVNDSRAIGPLIEALWDSNKDVEKSAIEAIVTFYDEKVLFALVEGVAKKGFDLPEKEFVKIAEKLAKKKVEHRNITRVVHTPLTTKILGSLEIASEKPKAQLIRLLGYFFDDRIFSSLEKFSNGPSPEVRRAAVFSLSRMEGKNIVDVIIKKVKDNDERVKHEAITALINFPGEKTFKFLSGMLANADNARPDVLSTLNLFDDSRTIDINIKMMRSNNHNIQYLATHYFTKNPDIRAVPNLISIINKKQGSSELGEAAEALGIIGDIRAVGPLNSILLEEPKRWKHNGFFFSLRLFSAESLGKLKDKRSITALRKVIKDPNENYGVHVEAAVALGEIGDKLFLEELEKLNKHLKKIGVSYKYTRKVVKAIKKLKGEIEKPIEIKNVENARMSAPSKKICSKIINIEKPLNQISADQRQGPGFLPGHMGRNTFLRMVFPGGPWEKKC